ncbi:hypothetical protein CCHR01_14928 [Colletotrichum chrysophilum]|uniref:Uncharacterized protein n=1 Tax=Colletotrichum chrysophilum TaxID=1836956 RepID=A0AAD9A7N8_9PEZI|nr:hypothetical protein CCHR01_14928 [Colletotrichum chrysophilum]
MVESQPARSCFLRLLSHSGRGWLFPHPEPCRGAAATDTALAHTSDHTSTSVPSPPVFSHWLSSCESAGRFPAFAVAPVTAHRTLRQRTACPSIPNGAQCPMADCQPMFAPSFFCPRVSLQLTGCSWIAHAWPRWQIWAGLRWTTIQLP